MANYMKASCTLAGVTAGSIDESSETKYVYAGEIDRDGTALVGPPTNNYYDFQVGKNDFVSWFTFRTDTPTYTPSDPDRDQDVCKFTYDSTSVSLSFNGVRLAPQTTGKYNMTMEVHSSVSDALAMKITNGTSGDQNKMVTEYQLKATTDSFPTKTVTVTPIGATGQSGNWTLEDNYLAAGIITGVSGDVSSLTPASVDILSLNMVNSDKVTQYSTVDATLSNVVMDTSAVTGYLQQLLDSSEGVFAYAGDDAALQNAIKEKCGPGNELEGLVDKNVLADRDLGIMNIASGEEEFRWPMTVILNVVADEADGEEPAAEGGAAVGEEEGELELAGPGAGGEEGELELEPGLEPELEPGLEPGGPDVGGDEADASMGDGGILNA